MHPASLHQDLAAELEHAVAVRGVEQCEHGRVTGSFDRHDVAVAALSPDQLAVAEHRTRTANSQRVTVEGESGLLIA